MSRVRLTYHDGALASGGRIHLLATADEYADQDIPHAVLLTRDGDEWTRELIRWQALSLCVVGGEELVVIGHDGEFLARGPQGAVSGTIAGEQVFRRVHAIDGCVFAVGMLGAVHRREGGVWVSAARGLDRDVDLEALDGFASDDIYAVGWHGALWHFDGQTWSPCELPTNVVLTGVVCAPDGVVYCAGQAGLFVRGRGDVWEIIEHDVTLEDFWGIGFHDGRVYLATVLAIYVWDDDAGLTVVDLGDDAPDTCYRLRVADGSLLSVGGKDCMLLAGTRWSRLAGTR